MIDEAELPQEAIGKIAEVLSQSEYQLPITNDAFYEACALVAARADISLIFPSTNENKNTLSLLQALADQSRFRFREVVLEDDWWQEDNGPLLGFLCEDNYPCALLPHKKGYEVIIPGQNKSMILNKKNAGLIAKNAFYFYKPLPDELLSSRDVFRFAWRQIKPDFWRAAILQLMLSLIALSIPIATGYLFSTIIPFADIKALQQLLLLLVISVFIAASLRYVQVVSLFRIKLKANATLQAALWDRILRFPVSFFHKFEAGDLANRINAIDAIQQEMNIAILLSLTNCVQLLLLLLFLFYVAPELTALVLIPVCFAGIVSAILTSKQLHYLRNYFNLLGETYSLLLQFFSSINKIRSSHCEKNMFMLWLEKFYSKTLVFLKGSNIAVISGVFNLVFSLVITLIVYSFMILSVKPMALGTFIMYSTALTQMFTLFINIWSNINQFVRIIPIFERTRPLLNTSIEESKEETLKPVITGKIEFRDVVFKYPGNETPICDHFNLQIDAGQYIGILGQSGTGKSSLIRLLLGFEKPLAGSILFDDCDLAVLDKHHLRSQLSVILQNSLLMPGTVQENIIGIHTELTLNDAWEAAKLANIANDIENMPMGMQTLISEGGRSLSVGQRQRVLLARALAKKSRILILDEAMSGMDNQTLEVLQTCVENLHATRIIITQRPEFLKNADNIYLLQQGRIAEQGNYKELKGSVTGIPF
ncbi:hypothetical protein B6N58_04890 [Legionella micdadei]|uniref:ATP-binding cassette domain-containing protein n=1 Tax=Legionella micdadei TaxID=451 RepID=UPI0009EF72A4|nr:ATP-binding cassette domain-containing protein [Legionella micdadei]ARG97056.1 hypothetical protein B6N58_04890 [Legionella micdadei]NSL18280.1 ATP-binding cassette domain-containing protein [Legionella micdadei]